MINTNRLRPMLSISACEMPCSLLTFDIFWIEVTIKRSSLSVLCSLLTRMAVFCVSCITSDSPAKPRYSSSDCMLSSIRSIRNTTLSASPELAISCADLKLVMVLPEPVVCQMKPPRCWCVSQLVLWVTSLILLTAKY